MGTMRRNKTVREGRSSANHAANAARALLAVVALAA